MLIIVLVGPLTIVSSPKPVWMSRVPRGFSLSRILILVFVPAESHQLYTADWDDMLPVFVSVYEIGIGDASLFDCVSEGAYSEFFMEGNNTTSIVFS